MKISQFNSPKDYMAILLIGGAITALLLFAILMM